MPLESPLAYNMYLFNLRIANHILIKIIKNTLYVLSVGGHCHLVSNVEDWPCGSY